VKRTIISGSLVLGAVLAALLVGRVAPQVGAAQAATSTTDITFKEGTCGQKGAHCKSIYRRNPTGFGARLIFSLPLSSAGDQAIREKGECTFLNKRSGQYFCTYNIRLAGGVVSVQGALPYTLNRSASIPVTGGTGVYEGAYGQLTLLKNPNPPVRYQLHIITP
jgi:hypothetical protein